MAFGLYTGLGLIDDFPRFKNINSFSFLSKSAPSFDFPLVDGGEGLLGCLLSILLWILMTIFLVVLSLFLEVVFGFSLIIILTTLYWVFFRALKLVFSKSGALKGNIGLSMLYAAMYVLLYLGWIFGVVYLTELCT